MAKSTKHKVVIIGCGNLAWHLANHFQKLGFEFTVYNHKKSSVLLEFNKRFKCKIKADLDEIEKGADFYFICVSDQYIKTVSKKIKGIKKDALVMHCSGSTPIADLKTKVGLKGVFYPLFTFTRKDTINWGEIPVLLESTDHLALNKLKAIAKLFTTQIKIVDSITRTNIHLAAVLVSNFTNSLFAAAEGLIKTPANPNHFQLLLPLIDHTVKKIHTMSPLVAQTGPAKRKDIKVQKKHLKMLEEKEEIRKIYKLMSELIAKQQKRNG